MNTAHAAPGHGRLLEKLMGAVRAEFRTELFVPDPADPVLGVRTCRVADCDRSVSQNALCCLRWKRCLAAMVESASLAATSLSQTASLSILMGGTWAFVPSFSRGNHAPAGCFRGCWRPGGGQS